MANGQQAGQKNLENFRVWAASRTDEDFKQIIHRGSLNRGEIAKGVDCGKSALTQNPAIRQEIEMLENDLRTRGVLPPLAPKSDERINEPKKYDASAKKAARSAARAGELERENLELKAKIKELEQKLARYGELSETLSEMGFMPR